jgi:hypothetical protein
MLVEVPCDPDQFVHKSELDTTVCYDGEAIEGATQQEEFTLMCNSYSAKNEADLRDRGVAYSAVPRFRTFRKIRSSRLESGPCLIDQVPVSS